MRDLVNNREPARFFYRATACNATHGIAMALLSVRLSVRLSNAWNVTKQKNRIPTFLHHITELFAVLVFGHRVKILTLLHVYRSFPTRQNGWWRRSFVPEILDQTVPVRAKTPIFNRKCIKTTSVVPDQWCVFSAPYIAVYRTRYNQTDSNLANLDATVKSAAF